MSWKEVRIPVPWGYVAGKWWGPQNQRPILVTHGWQENSGTFDKLLPLLPNDISFLAVDFPGCGLSTKLPTGGFYHIIDLVTLLRRIVKYFDWSTVSLIGHSLGAAVNFVYAFVYPNDVDFLISLDSLKPNVDDDALKYMGREMDRFLNYDYINTENKHLIYYPFEEIKQKVCSSTKTIEIDKCGHILERNLRCSEEDPQKFYFAVDPRLKVFRLLNFSQQELVRGAASISCPILYIKSNSNVYFERKENLFQVIEVLKNNNKKFEMHEVEGNHHVHLNNPERVEGFINDFLKKYHFDDKIENSRLDDIFL